MSLIRCMLIACCIFFALSAAGCKREEGKRVRLEKITVSDVKTGELETFARTYVKVQSALEEDVEESGAQTYERTTAIVRREGLTVERYTQLAQLMNEDAGFKEAVNEVIQRIKREGTEGASKVAE